MQCPVLSYAIPLHQYYTISNTILRRCYAMSGTDLARAPRSLRAHPRDARAHRRDRQRRIEPAYAPPYRCLDPPPLKSQQKKPTITVQCAPVFRSFVLAFAVRAKRFVAGACDAWY
eukprot:426401-Rhodomonas_salina.1